jgi:hypothetical protein
MYTQESDTVLAELTAVYRSASAQAQEVVERSRNCQLPLLERLRFRRDARELQELADLALRMIHELTASAAA